MIAGSALLLSLLGSLLVWSATKPRLVDAGDDPNTFFKRHLLNLAIGLVLCAVFTVVDYRALRAYAPLVYIASCLGLVAVLLVGTTINGAHSWIVLGGGFQVQPSEFAKVALVAGMAVLLAERRTHERATRSRDVPLVLALAAVPLGLVMLQPDLGTAMVFVFTVFGVLLLAGAPARWLGGLVLAGVLVVFGAVQLGVLKEYQLERFKAFTQQDQDTLGRRVQHHPGPDRDRQRRADRDRAVQGHPDDRQVRARAADRLRLHGRRRGARAGRRRRDHPAVRAAAVADAAAGRPVARPVRPAGRRRRGLLVRVPDVRQHRDDARHHADHRPAAAVRLVRRLGHVRQLDGHRPAAQRGAALGD